MASARVIRFCGAIHTIDNLATNPTFSILRSLPSLQRFPSWSCRARPPLPTTKLHGRQFSVGATTASDPIKPLQEESEANGQQMETSQEHKARVTETIAEGQPNLTTTSPSTSNAPSTETTTEVRQNGRMRLPERTPSDLDFLKTSRRFTGTVIRTHTMAKTVAVATTRQYFDRFLQKHYTRQSKTLVHDPTEVLIKGDVIEYGPFPPVERAQRIKKGKGKSVKYMVMRIVTPFGVSLEQRGQGVVDYFKALSKKMREEKENKGKSVDMQS